MCVFLCTHVHACVCTCTHAHTHTHTHTHTHAYNTTPLSKLPTNPPICIPMISDQLNRHDRREVRSVNTQTHRYTRVFCRATHNDTTLLWAICMNNARPMSTIYWSIFNSASPLCQVLMQLYRDIQPDDLRQLHKGEPSETTVHLITSVFVANHFKGSPFATPTCHNFFI